MKKDGMSERLSNMDVCELKNKIENIINNSFSISLFLVLKTEEGLTIKKADIENGLTTKELSELFGNRLRTISNNDELRIASLSSSDESPNSIYEYDYDEYPEDMLIIKDFDMHSATEIEKFSFSNDKLNSLMGYIIYIGNMENGITCFKKHFPFSLIKREAFLLYKHNERFKKLDADDILRLNEDIHLFKIDDKIFVLDIKVVESYLGFEELIRNRAQKAIDDISSIEIVEDINILREAAKDITFSRKLSKIAGQSLIISQSIPNEKVIEFSKKHPGLKNAFRYSEDGKKISLDTKVSQKSFLKLLNDDFLISELTNQSYDSLAKDRININNE